MIIPTARFHVTFEILMRQMYGRANLDLLRKPLSISNSAVRQRFTESASDLFSYCERHQDYPTTRRGLQSGRDVIPAAARRVDLSCSRWRLGGLDPRTFSSQPARLPRARWSAHCSGEDLPQSTDDYLAAHRDNRATVSPEAVMQFLQDTRSTCPYLRPGWLKAFLTRREPLGPPTTDSGATAETSA